MRQLRQKMESGQKLTDEEKATLQKLQQQMQQQRPQN
jgi:gluconate kinase